MAQNDLVIANQSAPNFRADLNNALSALASLSSGSSAPSNTFANMLWYDTASNTIKMRTEADDAWIDMFYIDQSTRAMKLFENTELKTTEGDTTTVLRLGDFPESTWKDGDSEEEMLISPAKLYAAIKTNSRNLVAILSDTKPQGTSGQTHSANVWTTHDLNTIDYNPSSLVTRSANRFTVENDGVVMCRVKQRDGVRIRLYNVTDSTALAFPSIGTNMGGGDRASSLLTAPVEAGKQYRLEFIHNTSGPCGPDNITGVDEVYAIVEYWA